MAPIVLPEIRKVTKSVFDLKTSLLLSMRTERQSADSKEMSPSYTQRFQWRRASECYVPSRIEGEQPKTLTEPDRTRIEWSEQYEVAFRWFSLNSPIEDDPEYQQLLNDPNKVLKFVDATEMKDITSAIE